MAWLLQAVQVGASVWLKVLAVAGTQLEETELTETQLEETQLEETQLVESQLAELHQQEETCTRLFLQGLSCANVLSAFH